MTRKTSESGWTIPNDWDGVTWTCYQITWPDSPKFELLLRSILYSLTRGRDWDGFTGNIKTAQLVGWDIFNRNSPLIPCVICPGPGPEPEPEPEPITGAIGSGAILESEEENDMGQVVTDVDIVDGKIRVFFGPCCYKILDGLEAEAVYSNLGDQPLDPGETGEVEYSACGKAYAVVQMIDKVLTAAHQAVSTVDYTQFFTVGSFVEDLVGLDLNDKYLIALIVEWWAFGAILSPAEVFSESDQQISLCALVGLFADDAVGVPDASTYEAVKAAIHTRNFLYDGFIMYAVSALGRGNLDLVAKLGAGNLEADCSCPDTGGDPNSLQFTGAYYNIDEQEGASDGVMGIVAISGDHQQIDVRWTIPTGDDYTERTCIFYLNPGETAVEYVDLKYAGEVPKSEWNLESCDLYDANLSGGRFDLLEGSIVQTREWIEFGSGYAVMRHHFTQGGNPIAVHPTTWGYRGGTTARACPNNPGNGAVFNWTVEIVAAGEEEE